MASIIIKNIGPIKEAQFDLNKINVFMGPQSSGKSTIAKIISYCTWVEKDVATSQSLETYQKNKKYFREHIENFHKIKGYFRPDSYLSYKSDVVELKWDKQESEIKWVDQYAYKRSKISYIPSERNMIILPDVKKVEFGNTNIRSFLFDWFDARKNYPKENRLSILNLGVEYYYKESGTDEEDHIRSVDKLNEFDILLSNASSGLQSITPIIGMIEYLTNWIYKEDNTSFELEEKQRKVHNLLTEEIILKPYFGNSYNDLDVKELINRYVKKYNEGDLSARKVFAKYYNLRENLFKTKNSQFIIEEPEQNLFPKTQCNLVYHLIENCANRDGNMLTITTHSPYVLYALNNCMLGHLVKEKMLQEEDYLDLKSLKSSIDPSSVSVWQITDKGTINKIQGDDYLIEGNYFDSIMKDVMDDFYKMINYYGDEDED